MRGFGLIENEHRTRQALRGIKKVLRAGLPVTGKQNDNATIKVGICGLGTVGQGVIALLSGWRRIENRVGGMIELVHVATRTPKPEVDTLGARDSRDVFDVARDPNVDVLLSLLAAQQLPKSLLSKH